MRFLFSRDQKRRCRREKWLVEKRMKLRNSNDETNINGRASKNPKRASKLNYKRARNSGLKLRNNTRSLKFQNSPICFVISRTRGNLKYISYGIYPKAIAGPKTPTFAFVCPCCGRASIGYTEENNSIYPLHSSYSDESTTVRFAFSTRIQRNFQNYEILIFNFTDFIMFVHKGGRRMLL